MVSACRECGYGVPEEISVIGAGNIASAACFFPPLTTIADDLPGSVRAIREGLEELFGGGRFGIRTVPAGLIERQSVRNLAER